MTRRTIAARDIRHARALRTLAAAIAPSDADWHAALALGGAATPDGRRAIAAYGERDDARVALQAAARMRGTKARVSLLQAAGWEVSP